MKARRTMEDRNEDERARLQANEAKRKAGMIEGWLYRIEGLLENPMVRAWLSLEDVANLRASMGAVMAIAERIRGTCAKEMTDAGIKPEGMSPFKKEA